MANRNLSQKKIQLNIAGKTQDEPKTGGCPQRGVGTKAPALMSVVATTPRRPGDEKSKGGNLFNRQELQRMRQASEEAC